MQEVKAGAILVKESPLMARYLGLETESCCGAWRLVKAQDGFAVERKVRAAGWSFFFMADEVKVMFFGAPAAKKIQKALQGILEKLRGQDFRTLSREPMRERGEKGYCVRCRSRDGCLLQKATSRGGKSVHLASLSSKSF